MTRSSSDEQPDELYICPFDKCKAVFPRPSRLQYHLNTHEVKKPYACEVEGCEKTYTNPWGLKRHKKSHEPKSATTYQRPIVCTETECNKTFACDQNLQRHIKETHEKKTYKCDVCSKAFKKNIQLKNHEFLHKGPKPFVCMTDGCDKTFNTKSHLTQHQKFHEGHHYTCSTEGCDFECEKWTLLRKHRKLEHPPEYKCGQCDKVFHTKSNFRHHSTTHDSEREIFPCPHAGCGRFYYHAKNLTHHTRSTHEGKTFDCTHDGCNRKFKHKVVLDRHSKLHSPSPDYKEKKKRKCRKRRSVLFQLSSFKLPYKMERLRLQDVNAAPDLSTTSESSDSDSPSRIVLTSTRKGDGESSGRVATLHDISDSDQEETRVEKIVHVRKGEKSTGPMNNDAEHTGDSAVDLQCVMEQVEIPGKPAIEMVQ